MSVMKKWLSVILGIGLLAAAHTAGAETNVDLRLKLGSSAGVDKVEFSNIDQSDASQSDSGNFQIEAAFTPRQSSPVNFVGTIGLFSRNHEGHVTDPVFPTDVKYDASGVSGSVGVSVAANEDFHFEGRLELASGSGKPTLSTPFVVWNPTKEGSYTATSVILGGYYTISKPGLQVGLELGTQSFKGEFQIWNNAGFWSDGNVKGSGGIANLIIGYRF